MIALPTQKLCTITEPLGEYAQLTDWLPRTGVGFKPLFFLTFSLFSFTFVVNLYQCNNRFTDKNKTVSVY